MTRRALHAAGAGVDLAGVAVAAVGAGVLQRRWVRALSDREIHALLLREKGNRP